MVFRNHRARRPRLGPPHQLHARRETIATNHQVIDLVTLHGRRSPEATFVLVRSSATAGTLRLLLLPGGRASSAIAPPRPRSRISMYACDLHRHLWSGSSACAPAGSLNRRYACRVTRDSPRWGTASFPSTTVALAALIAAMGFGPGLLVGFVECIAYRGEGRHQVFLLRRGERSGGAAFEFVPGSLRPRHGVASLLGESDDHGAPVRRR